jgi:hypothetical protein
MTLAIDGTATGVNTGLGVATCTLTTTNTNDIIILFVSWDNGGGTTFTITDTANLTWHLRASENTGNSSSVTREYYAVSSGALTADIITCTASSGTNRLALVAFGVSGANTSTPYDPGVGVPVTANSQSSVTSLTANVVTTAAVAMVIGFIAIDASATETYTYTPTGTALIATQADSGHSDTAYFKVVTPPFNMATGASWNNASAVSLINDAIQQASGSASVLLVY